MSADQARDSHGRWTTSGMSERLADAVEREEDALIHGGGQRYAAGHIDTLKTALANVINSSGDERVNAKLKSEARRVYRQISKEYDAAK